MNKEINALKIGIPKLKKLYENNAKKMGKNDILGFDLTFVYLDKVLQYLEAIENADPSEALECLEKLGTHRIEYCESFELGSTRTMPFKSTIEYKTIQYALLKAQETKKNLI